MVLLFKPTIGEDAKPDGQPIRYDFTTGLVANPNKDIIDANTTP